MRTTAEIVETNIGPRVRVNLSNGLCDWPILYQNGLIAYDNPAQVPQFIRPRVRRLLRLILKDQEEQKPS